MSRGLNPFSRQGAAQTSWRTLSGLMTSGHVEYIRPTQAHDIFSFRVHLLSYKCSDLPSRKHYEQFRYFSRLCVSVDCRILMGADDLKTAGIAWHSLSCSKRFCWERNTKICWGIQQLQSNPVVFWPSLWCEYYHLIKLCGSSEFSSNWIW